MIKVDNTEISYRGKQLKVNSIVINGVEIVVTGKYVRTASVKDEWDDEITDPDFTVKELIKSTLHADILTFVQRIPETKPKYHYYMELEAIASMSIVSFNEWWENLPRKTRQNIRKTEKHGVSASLVDFNDDIVKGIMDIYNDTPIRQGKPFWHYGKNFDTVKRENSTYLDKSYIIGAHYNKELIGFIKLVCSGQFATTMQIISKIKNRDDALKPTSLLIAKAVEICERNNIQYFTYGLWGDGSLSEFKRRNGFEKVFIPRYYIPITKKGRLILKLNLHHGVARILPEKWMVVGKNIRKIWYARRFRGTNPQEIE